MFQSLDSLLDGVFLVYGRFHLLRCLNVWQKSSVEIKYVSSNVWWHSCFGQIINIYVFYFICVIIFIRSSPPDQTKSLHSFLFIIEIKHLKFCIVFKCIWSVKCRVKRFIIQYFIQNRLGNLYDTRPNGH